MEADLYLTRTQTGKSLAMGAPDMLGVQACA